MIWGRGCNIGDDHNPLRFVAKAFGQLVVPFSSQPANDCIKPVASLLELS